MKNKVRSLKELNFLYWLVDNIIPKTLVYFCAMRVLAIASTEKFADVEMGKIGAFEAVEYYGEKYNV